MSNTYVKQEHKINRLEQYIMWMGYSLPSMGSCDEGGES